MPRNTLWVAFVVTVAERDDKPIDSVAVALCSRLDAVARALPDTAELLGLALSDAASTNDCVESADCVILALLESEVTALLVT